jgi:hypothetical protein
LTYQPFAIPGKSDDGRRRAHALSVFDNVGCLAIHDSHARIRRAKVNANDFRHVAHAFI